MTAGPLRTCSGATSTCACARRSASNRTAAAAARRARPRRREVSVVEAEISFADDDGPAPLARLFAGAPPGSFVTIALPEGETELADGSVVKVPHFKLIVHHS